MFSPRLSLLKPLFLGWLAIAFLGPIYAQVSNPMTGPQPWWPAQPRPLPLVHPLFGSEMVLQRDTRAPVWGWCKSGSKVVVRVDGNLVAEAVADSGGRWAAKIGPFSAGGPHTLEVSGEEESKKFEDVLFGDVWLCSGQSNMNWPVRLSENAEQEVKRANNPNIRSFTVGLYSALAPEPLPPVAKWEPCKSEFSANFTGVGYFFARELESTQKVPIGILHASVGATAAEAWVSAEALAREMPDDFTVAMDELEAANAPFEPGFSYFTALEKWAAKVDPESARKKYSSDVDLDTRDWLEIGVPKNWKEAGIAELTEFDGLVWFRQHLDIPESFAGRDLQLNLSVVHDADIVWFNGQVVGGVQSSGRRTYQIPRKFVKPGRNLLCVAVVSHKGASGFVSNPVNLSLRPETGAGKESMGIAGVWRCKKSVEVGKLEPMPTPRTGNYKTITGLYNGMIAPLVPFAIKGALWYQGEANGPFAQIYRRLLPTLIKDWRSHFGVGDFPFLIVSLANYNAPQTKPTEVSGYQGIRESQWLTVRNVPNTGLAMAVDIGDSTNIHPRNKQEVGRRLSLVARKQVYGERDLVASGPEFEAFKVDPPGGNRLRLSFKHIGGGLRIKEGQDKLTGFAIAGEDGDFVWANAVIDGDTVLVSSDEISHPKHVRYGWAWSPVVNLYNKEGLPAVTFRSDEDREVLITNAYANDRTVGALANHPTLENVKLGPKETTRLTDACLVSLATIPNLKELTIVGTALSFDKGLSHLKKAAKLRKLNLGKVALPEGDLEKIQAALPGVEIDFTPMPPEYRELFESWRAKGR